jgi:hypothetical protein
MIINQRHEFLSTQQAKIVFASFKLSRLRRVLSECDEQTMFARSFDMTVELSDFGLANGIQRLFTLHLDDGGLKPKLIFVRDHINSTIA